MSSAASDVDLTSTITCPSCHAATEATMPTGRCQFFWDCPACEAVLRPKEGDCCVFCSYGSVPCPSMQQSGGANACCAD
ncbi:MAG: hypothetical protein BRD40_00730 [Bacteroidetes bacterium QS_1_65_9]|nr:MAG: hypothetical protein BRD40_00730 [Bacteroidetes bacterium QS_1_65_9]